MIVRHLDGCTALVSGSTGGIGYEIAAQLAEAGVPSVMINGRDQLRGEAAAERIRQRAPGCKVLFTSADPSQQAQAKELVQKTIDAFGTLDILVNSISGHLPPMPFHEVPENAIAPLVMQHLNSVFYVCLAAMPHLMVRKGGVILNLASDAAKVETPGEPVQGARKADVVMFSRALALEAKRHGIRVHSLTPSLVKDTAGYGRVMSSEFSKKLFDKAARKAHLGVVGSEDIAPLAVLLASPAASNITDQNGGISAA